MMRFDRVTFLLFFVLLAVQVPRICHSFLSSSPSGSITARPLLPSFSLSAVNPTTSPNDSVSSGLPIVEFTDPKTGCHVVLLGCFHGTASSSRDVQQVVTPETDYVALELCATRFSDLRQDMQKQQEESAGSLPSSKVEQQKRRPWAVAYIEMISKTVQKRGLPTGVAAAVLAGFSGLQTAISGFTPGLEFTTAVDCSIENDCDVILADQVVDETLRRIGTLPQISWQMNVQSILSKNDNNMNTWEEWNLHASTLKTAVMGDDDKSLPRVELGQFLFRNSAAVQDLVRLTIPPIFMFLILTKVLVATATTGNDLDVVDNLSMIELIPHWIASFGIMFGSFVGLVLPAVKVILTERDEILTSGIQASCQRAGSGGRVVAVLGLLHVNGVAKRMIQEEKSETNF